MNVSELQSTVHDLLAERKGILAADESFGTIGKRFAGISVESTPQSRRSFRELLFSAPHIENYLSGVILFDETIRQATADGVPFARLLQDRKILPGIKVDKGTKPLAFFPDEKITEGLDALRERLQEYRALGARFAKWRTTYSIGPALPGTYAIEANAWTLARYAALCQEERIVPIVEPEVLMDGEHGIEECESATTAVLSAVFEHLRRHRVVLEAVVLKPNMVIPGNKSKIAASPEQVAEATIRTLRRTVPASLPGIAFLSGGQSPRDAARNLDAINRTGTQPWRLTFSFSRAIQEPVLESWHGQEANIESARQILLHRTQLCSEASMGTYRSED